MCVFCLRLLTEEKNWDGGYTAHLNDHNSTPASLHCQVPGGPTPIIYTFDIAEINNTSAFGGNRLFVNISTQVCNGLLSSGSSKLNYTKSLFVFK